MTVALVDGAVGTQEVVVSTALHVPYIDTCSSTSTRLNSSMKCRRSAETVHVNVLTQTARNIRTGTPTVMAKGSRDLPRGARDNHIKPKFDHTPKKERKKDR